MLMMMRSVSRAEVRVCECGRACTRVDPQRDTSGGVHPTGDVDGSACAPPTLSTSAATYISYKLMSNHKTAPHRLSIPTVNGNTVLSFSTHGQQSAAKGSLTTVSRSDIRFIQHLDSSALGLARRWLLIGHFLILYYPHTPFLTPFLTAVYDKPNACYSISEILRCASRAR